MVTLASVALTMTVELIVIVELVMSAVELVTIDV